MKKKQTLTRKEAIVARYLIDDYTIKDIAALLCRSQNTIKMHIKHIKRKCDCKTSTGLGAILKDFMKNNPKGYIKNDKKE